MSGPTYQQLLNAGYKPAQIIVCFPCKCQDAGRPVKDCTFPKQPVTVGESR